MTDFSGNRRSPDDESERVRRLLDDAVADVEPRDSLASIQARTKVTPMQRNRPWFLGAAAAVVATAATVAAVTVLTGDGTTGEDPGVAGSPSSTPSTTEGTTGSSATPSPSPDAETTTETVPVYYAGDTSRGTRLFREFHRVEVVGGDAVAAAVNQAVSATPDDPDYRTDWPAGTSASSAEGTGTPDVITVDLRGQASLHDRPATMSEEQARMAVEQLVYTAQAASQTRAPVQLYLEGQRTDQVLGVPTSEPLAQGEAIDVLAQVWVIEPAEGAEVSAPFEVSGLAAAFEANVQWELKQGDTVVEQGFTTARECCTMAPYAFTVKQVPPGDYTLVVHDSDPSGGEGFAPWEDTKQITVR
ncbi:MAG: Gmad2 immunoglobulin-like domain-containing protein [Nocardioidaceae bacterium]